MIPHHRVRPVQRLEQIPLDVDLPGARLPDAPPLHGELVIVVAVDQLRGELLQERPREPHDRPAARVAVRPFLESLMPGQRLVRPADRLPAHHDLVIHLGPALHQIARFHHRQGVVAVDRQNHVPCVARPPRLALQVLAQPAHLLDATAPAGIPLGLALADDRRLVAHRLPGFEIDTAGVGGEDDGVQVERRRGLLGPALLVVLRHHPGIAHHPRREASRRALQKPLGVHVRVHPVVVRDELVDGDDLLRVEAVDEPAWRRPA